MRSYFTILIGLCLGFIAHAQVSFKTIAPQRPIAVGESFQIQFTIDDDEEIAGFKAPPFTNFRVVTGPNIYYGSIATPLGVRPLVNTVYTLDAFKPGRFIIKGATLVYKGETIQSNEVLVEVISREEAARRLDKEIGNKNSAYFLRPGENGLEKIKQNLFLKVMVDKKKCFVGEPIVATFKLYSRLESRSDIVKNPGFYGFTVCDMINLSDRLVTLENINGKQFDVHTIRKVQLYPLQAGEFIIDPMEITNKVEFSRSAINRKTEQEIVEGIMGNEDETDPAEGTETFETEMHTEAVKIEVKSLPTNAKPVDFNGAVGAYSIRASVIKKELSRNEEGIFELVIAGKGNFIQLDAPVVKWPVGLEGFAPAINDRLDRSRLPLAGQRVFRFPFVASRAATYVIPPIKFSFYNPDSGLYKTVSTQEVNLNVTKELKPVNRIEIDKVKNSSGRATFLISLAGAILVILVGLFLYRRKKSKQIKPEQVIQPLPGWKEILAPAYAQLDGGDKIFYDALHQSIWNFLGQQLEIKGSEMNKKNLLEQMNKIGIPMGSTAELIQIMELCESAKFTNASLLQDKRELLEQTGSAMEEITRSLF